MPPIAPPDVPIGAQSAMERLASAGFEAWLVGEAVRSLLAAGVARDFEVITTASEERILTLFDEAVPTTPAAHRCTLPTHDGPVDLVSMPSGVPLARALDHRDFTIRAIAWDPVARAWIDPHEGRADLAKGVLRAVGDARARLGEDPSRALRAGRLVAQQRLETDAALVSAMRKLGRAIEACPRVRLRDEAVRMLSAPHADEGLRLLRASGVERTLAPGASDMAADLVAQLPVDVPLRLAAWLHGAHPIRVMRRLRMPRPWVMRVEALMQLHPIEQHASRPHDRRRLAQRPAREIRDLIALRAAEIVVRDEGERAEAALREVESDISRAREELRHERERPSLAIDGRAIMEHLDCDPGPQIGEALNHLREFVQADPSRNVPATLRAALDVWRASRQQAAR